MSHLMRVRVDYGVDGLDVELPRERVTIIEPIFRPAITDPHAALTAALRAPLGRPPLKELVRRGQTIAISVCDVTRAQPRREMLTALFAEMPHVRAEDVTILIATGTHRANTPAELELMLGADIAKRYRVVNHDSRRRRAPES
jgi:nickel-dependent lactate racemase